MLTVGEIGYANLTYPAQQADGLTQLVEKLQGKLSRDSLYRNLDRNVSESGKPREVRDVLARNLEHALGIERGWIDRRPRDRQSEDVAFKKKDGHRDGAHFVANPEYQR